ncbi:ABC transporter permease [Spirosoma sp. BT702]|uniref:ABC transporter permease n=1 Tax=Spirosoma profusum TaxID=2771354 RepID=A0A927ATH2_9BACT|nr:ABC transporter permease [Spirosoma profusum]MBD2700212.1 ABC transporter permease [Spirosoma profusum]
MKQLIASCLLLAILHNPLFAQQAQDIQAGQPVQLNGLDYGYEINNERRLDISGEIFMRYEISIYVSNKSSCTKLFLPKQTLLGQEDLNQLAFFDCVNATGKRLTSRGAKIMARPFSVPYQQRIKNAEGKEVNTTTYVQAGHMLRNGETVSNTFVAIVPDGEKPIMKVRIREIPEL